MLTFLYRRIWHKIPQGARASVRLTLSSILAKFNLHLPYDPLTNILTDELNRGHRLKLLSNYFRWFLFNKPRQRTFQITFPNGTKSIVYPDSDSGVSSIYSRNVDYYDFAFIRRVLEKGDFIIDAGCNVGNRTLMLADIIRGALLIDANKKCFHRLEQSFDLNKLDMSNYYMVPKAAGSSSGTVEFTDVGGTSTQNRVVAADDREAPETISVEMTTLDDEMDNIGNPPCSFIKTDLEGYDLDALAGATRTLRHDTMKLVRFERWQRSPLQGFVDFFAALDWAVFTLDPSGIPTTSGRIIESSRNLFAMPRRILPDILGHQDGSKAVGGTPIHQAGGVNRDG